MAAKLRFVLSGEAREVLMPEMDGWNPNAVRHELNEIAGRQQLWNRSAALEILGRDEGLLNEMVQLFLEESPKLVAQMEKALFLQDPRLLELAAHSLKGELSYLVVPDASETAEKLETAGRTGEMEAAADLLFDLQTRLALLWAAVSQTASSEG